MQYIKHFWGINDLKFYSCDVIMCSYRLVDKTIKKTVSIFMKVFKKIINWEICNWFYHVLYFNCNRNCNTQILVNSNHDPTSYLLTLIYILFNQRTKTDIFATIQRRIVNITTFHKKFKIPESERFQKFTNFINGPYQWLLRYVTTFKTRTFGSV